MSSTTLLTLAALSGLALIGYKMAIPSIPAPPPGVEPKALPGSIVPPAPQCTYSAPKLIHPMHRQTGVGARLQPLRF